VAAAIRLRGAAIGGAAILAALIWSAPAHALTLENPSAEPVNLQAGANSDFEVHLEIGEAEDQLRDLTVELPPGVGGNPQAVEKCAVPDFEAGNCTAATQVGTTTAGVTATVLGFVPVALTVNGTVFNLVPNPGEPARLGIQLNALPFTVPVLGDALLPPIRNQVEASLRPDDLGLNTFLDDLPQQATVLGMPTDVDITSLDLTLDETFMFNPTSCNLAVTRFIATSWADNPGEPVTAETAGFTPTGCENQAYSPQAGILIDAGAKFDSPELPKVVTTVEQAPNEANGKRVDLLMPAGLGPNAPVALGTACTVPQFQSSSCPPATRVGSAVAQSPLLASPLNGLVYLVDTGDLFPSVGIDLKGDLNLQLTATADLVPPDTRVRSTLDDLPDLPLSKFTLTFGGGPGGLFVALPKICSSSPRLDATFDSHGGQQVTRSVKPEVRGCGSGSSRRAKCGGRRVTIPGTRRRDVLRGTRRRDVIAGFRGNDVIRGLGGNDILCGGGGRDKLVGGRGKDKLFGRKGPDRLRGGPGRDRLVGGKGRDRLFGGPGRDRLLGGRGRDLIRQ
jgi:RTX calcium-binding nonapeptide repeat (4 copies)